ncbi:MAG: ABC transporter substrate-binding protein [Desulfurococcaceae archaeon]
MNRNITSTVVLSLIVVSVLAIIAMIPTTEAQFTYRGPYVGEVEFIREPELPLSLEKMIGGAHDVMFDPIETGAMYRRVLETGLPYTVSYGLYYEITVNYRCKLNETTGEIIEPVFPNPSKLPRPEVEGKILFNPFCNPRIRYALHLLIDRDFIAERIGEGLLTPRYTALTPAFPDYGRLADVIIPLEMRLKYNFAEASRIIREEMIKMGAEFRDGKWYYKGEPVILIFLIRIEDVRKPIGDYISSQLERLGFTVLRYYGRAPELAPYWIFADPDDGTMHLYTGGWITTVVARDQSGNFGFFYTKLGRPELLWQRIINTPEFFEIARRLYYNEFKSLEERRELMARALELSVTVENQRIFVANRISVWARRPNVILASDLAGGYSGAWLWPWTIRFTDLPPAALKDARVRIAYRDLLIQPWNPVGGTNWIFDQAVIRATGELPYYPDPYSGLYWPHRIKKAVVYVNEELPVFSTLPWVEVVRLPKDDITVPDDAWLLYDCETKKIYTVKEVEENPAIVLRAFNITGYSVVRTAEAKTIVYYDDVLFRGDYMWHDNSTFDIADFIHRFILTFDRACIGSPLYDSAYVPSFRAWFPNFRGFRIIQTDPLVIEYYTDIWYLDAEWIAGAAAGAFWPYYGHGPGPWHVVELIAEGERRGLVAFTSAKAAATGADWADLLSPKTLEKLDPILDEFITTGYIPYREVLSAYITPEKAAARWSNLKSWYTTMGHMWVGNGPFYLVSASKDRIVLRANRLHVDPPDKYAFLAEPPIPEIRAEVPSTVFYGRDITIAIELTDREGNPYPDDLVELVSYVIIHAGGVLSGRARSIGGGLWEITLTAEDTKQLSIGMLEFRIIAVSRVVGIPAVETKVATLVVPPELIFQQIEVVRKELVGAIDVMREQFEATVGELSSRLALVSQEVADAITGLGTSLTAMIEGVRTSLDVAIGTMASAIEVTREDVRAVSTKVDTLSGRVTGLESTVDERTAEVAQTVDSLSTIVYVVLALGVINLVVGAAGFLVRKK